MAECTKDYEKSQVHSVGMVEISNFAIRNFAVGNHGGFTMIENTQWTEKYLS